ncbi:DUF1127 domain-containing protein [Ruegeria arenilitoris]|uniref:DUF1127 domain-containing protein n=1 Tax=Ruegeria arenilitoris TaxID=1173585 RepID=UPI0014807CCC|nr:DUF1127 domain-containing protein [Ruegeria arenilitoris]
MAHTTALAHGGFNLSARIAKFVEGLKETRTKAIEYHRTYNELQRLSNRELDDIGLRRCDIADIAREQVYFS